MITEKGFYIVYLHSHVGSPLKFTRVRERINALSYCKKSTVQLTRESMLQRFNFTGKILKTKCFVESSSYII